MMQNDTQWHTMTHYIRCHMLPQWHTMTHNDTQWHTMTHDDTWWHTMTHDDTRWRHFMCVKHMSIVFVCKTCMSICCVFHVMIAMGTLAGGFIRIRWRVPSLTSHSSASSHNCMHPMCCVCMFVAVVAGSAVLLHTWHEVRLGDVITGRGWPQAGYPFQCIQPKGQPTDGGWPMKDVTPKVVDTIGGWWTYKGKLCIQWCSHMA